MQDVPVICQRPLHLLRRGWVPHYAQILRLGSFDPAAIRPLIHEFKYHRRWGVGEWLADRLLVEKRYLITPGGNRLPAACAPARGGSLKLPASTRAQIIALRLSRATGVPVISQRPGRAYTEMQTHLRSKADRMKNLKDAFRLNAPEEIAGLRVLVIDDVMTTGAATASHLPHTCARLAAKA